MSLAALCRLLDWDSSFFGIRIGRIESNRLSDDQFAQVLAWCHDHKIQCLYFLCAPDHDESVQIAEANGFHLIDIRIELDRPTGQIGYHCSTGTIGIRPHKDENIESLQKIAETVYHDTRFYYDRHFGTEQAAALYREWIVKSCSGYADRVLVAYHEGQIAGYITCHIEPEAQGRIGLVGVDPGMQDIGVGEALVWSALSYFNSCHVCNVRVVTQGRNIAAQRLYQKCGFRTSSVNLWYHKWFAEELAL